MQRFRQKSSRSWLSPAASLRKADLRIDQFLPQLRPGDALGNHALAMRKVLEAFGPSDIFVEQADPSLRRLVKDYRQYVPASDSAVVYHAAIGSLMAQHLLNLNTRIILDYHNVTPAHFLAPYDIRATSLALTGRIEISQFAKRAVLAIGHSDYSLSELHGMGFEEIAKVPVLGDLGSYDTEPNESLLRKLRAGKKGTDLLFVGRISPHKRQEDVIKVFIAYKQYFDPGARLFLVGGGSSERYSTALEDFIARMGVEDVELTGPIPTTDLHSHYRNADVFVSMSEHEGFCVPLLEAMRFEIPIIAFASTAIPETLGDAGVLFQVKRYEQIAAMIHLIQSEERIRGRLITKGSQRFSELTSPANGEQILGLIERALAK